MRPPCEVKALYQYASEHDDDLNFEVGQIIHVHNVEDDEWLNGSYTDSSGTKKEGIFPKNFVELLEAPKAPARPVRAIAQKGSDDDHIVDAAPVGTTSQETVPQLPIAISETTEIEASPPVIVSQASAAAPVQDKSTVSVIGEDIKKEAIPEHTADMSAGTKVIDNIARTVAQGQQNAPQIISEHKNETIQPAENVPKTNAFRDRIAAFNKQGAVPVAPKPMVKPSLAKKPFVAPPPSKNSYVPITTSKSRSNQPTAEPEPLTNAKSHLIRDEIAHESVTPEEPPKLGSLKDRIAALQAERSQLASKKSSQHEEVSADSPVDELAAHDHNSPISAEDVDQRTITQSQPLSNAEISEPQSSVIDSQIPPQIPQMPIVPKAPQTDYSETQQSAPTLARQRTNNSIEALQNQSTGASGQSQAPSQYSITGPAVPVASSQDMHQLNSTTDESADVGNIVSDDQIQASADVENDQDSSSSDDEVDEEERRKQQLRERMAKMSGGMGMGMHMALGLGGSTSKSSHSNKAKSGRASGNAHAEQTTESQAPIPMPGLPPLPRTIERHEAESDKNTHADGASTDVHQTSYDESERVQPADTTHIVLLDDHERHDSHEETEVLSDSIAQLSLHSEKLVPVASSFNTTTDAQPLSPPIRAAPPPIPGGRPISIQIPTQTDIASQSSPRLQGAPMPATSITSSDSVQPEQTARVGEPQSSEQVRSPPPVPMTSTRQRHTAGSPSVSASSPQYTPGGSKRMSYFGAVPSRPSMDIETRESSDYTRSSFDALSRTNSARYEPPARPPPPSIPASRAPPPPVPSAGQPSRTPSMPPTRMVSIPEPVSHDQAQQARADNQPRLSNDQFDKSSSLEADIVHREPQSLPATSAAVENEREGYEADDDETDVQSLNRPSTSGTRPKLVVEGAPQSAAALERSSTKKKGIKSLFKRKDK